MGHIFLSFVFYNIILITFYRHYKRGEYYIKKSDLIFYTFLLIAFGVYGGGEGDYIAYKKSVEENFQTLFDVYWETSFEIQYNYLAYALGGNYNLWRLVIYSVQFIGMSWLSYKAKMNTYPFFLSFVAICLVMSVYGRAFWGVIFYFLGVYLLIEKRNPLFLIIIALCYVSHTQNLVLIAMLPFAFIEMKKWHLLVILASLGTLVTLFQSFITGFLDSGGIEGADHLNSKMQIYGGDEKQLGAFGDSIGEVTMFVLQHVPAVSFMTFLLVSFLKSKTQNYLAKPYRRLINITFILMIAAFVVLFARIGSGTLFYRILALYFFPISIILPYLKQVGMIKTNTFNIIIMIYIFATELGYFKDLYYAYSGGGM